MHHYTRTHALYTVLAFVMVGAVLMFFLHANSYAAPSVAQKKPFTAPGDWPRYMYSDQHQGNNPNETALSKANVASLSLSWKFNIGANSVSSPIEVNGVIYQGSWKGYVYAIDATSGTQLWKTNVGVYTSPTCPIRGGPSGAAVVDNGMVYIGSGPIFYALNASTGAIVWQKTLGTSGTNNDHIWGSAAVANGKVYVGIASYCDHPLTQGMLYSMNEADGSDLIGAKIVPDGKLGGGIWSTPTIDAPTGTVIVTTGSNDYGNPIPMTVSVVTLDWNTLAVKQSWQVPPAEQIGDADFGSTPTLFPGPNGKTYFGVINKNTVYFVFDEANVSAGPVWQTAPGQLGPGGHKGGTEGSIASSAYVNGVLYIPTSLATVNGTSFGSSIGAFDALTGNILWRVGTANPIFGSVVTANGLLFDAQGKAVEIRDQSTGAILFTYPTVGLVKGSVTVLNGAVVIGDFGGHVYTLSVP